MRQKTTASAQSARERSFYEGFTARIGAWSGSTLKHHNAIQQRTNQYDVPVDPLRDLVDWLNQNDKTKSGQRIARLISSLQTFEELTQRRLDVERKEPTKQRTARIVNLRPGESALDHMPAEWKKLRDAANTAYVEAQTLLERYVLHPRLIGVAGRPKAYLFDFCCPILPDEAPPLVRDSTAEFKATTDAWNDELSVYHPGNPETVCFDFTCVSCQQPVKRVASHQGGAEFDPRPVKGQWVRHSTTCKARSTKTSRPIPATTRNVSEGDICVIICGIASRGDIKRVRRCDREGCQKFFYAEPSHKRRCSTECTNWKIDHDPNFKEHRKKYMRDVRAARKEGISVTEYRKRKSQDAPELKRG